MNIPAKKIFFLLVFSALVLVGSQINFSPLLGIENQGFTLFQMVGPIAGIFLGPVIGAASVLFAESVNFVYAGKALNIVNLFRLTPMLFAAYYFGTHGRKKLKELSTAVPILCMALFMLHPVGAQVWFYSLYWVIPVAAKFFPERLLLKSLGATFTAHAVGSTLFLYTVPTLPELWVVLIPIVAVERIVFALGISGSYIAVNTVLSKVASGIPSSVLSIDKRYVLGGE